MAWTRLAFVAIGATLAIVAIMLRGDWPAVLARGVVQANFICAFFVALATLRIPAAHSPAIHRCGRYLASRPPGKRYLALTTGGHLFSLILNYGAIQLLGAMVERMVSEETDPHVAAIRSRRMLVAIQRGFCASIFWSPLAFSMVITTGIIPGASWAAAVPLAIFHMAIFTTIGWAHDTLIKPKLNGPRPPARTAEGGVADLLPLLMLLLIIFGGVGLIEVLTGLRMAAIVMVFVPAVALGWLAIEAFGGSGAGSSEMRDEINNLIVRDLPAYRSELVLLIMAGFIGAVGGVLAKPWIAAMGIDLSAVPLPILLFAIMLFVPLAGQLGMNPILSVALFAPLLPAPEQLGIPPALMVLAIVSGWALTGLTSPFTATTMLIAKMGHITAARVGTSWNGMVFLIALAVLTLSLVILSFLLR
nr:hypothetical protein [Notoacmeibacter sp. MSK16QG-6]